MYTKHNYRRGDPLYASQLNEMDDQIALNEQNISANTQDIDEINTTIQEILESGIEAGLQFDSGYQDDDGYVHLTQDGEDIEGFEPFYVAGGGGGSEGTYIITLTNLTESRTITVSEGQEVYIAINYRSVDKQRFEDGPGIGTLIVNNISVATFNVIQGDNTFEISSYLPIGTNAVTLKVENSEGNSKSVLYSVTVATLSLRTSNDLYSINIEDVTFYYVPIGEGEKTVYFIMDGVQIGMANITASGRSQTFMIPKQNHGAHVFQAYATMPLGDSTLTSNTLTLGMIWTQANNPTPIILSTFDMTAASQGETIDIPYMVYDPETENATITLSVLQNGDEYSSSTLTVGRDLLHWYLRDYPAGNITLSIVCGSITWTHSLVIEASPYTFDVIQDSLVFDFNPDGRLNTEAIPDVWESNGISATFSGIGFTTVDGWQTDADGDTRLRILPGGQVTIPFKFFETDKRDSGATVEVEMSTHNVRDYNAVVFSCLSNNRGFMISSQFSEFHTEQSSLSMQFKEEERIRLTFSVESRNANRLIYVYVDGIMCGVVQYPSADNLAQNPAVGLTIGAAASGIDIYRILMYNKGLTRYEVLENYIADRATLNKKVELYEFNDIFNISDEIAIDKLPNILPYMIISCFELPQYKGDKKTCAITYVNPADSSRSFTAAGVQIDVQGTSSAGYKKKNFKFKLNNGITYTGSNEQAAKYMLRDNSIPEKTFCLKADVASSENTNNVELVRLYDDICPYQTLPQRSDPRVRQGIDGLPIVVFWQNTTTNVTKFWGKYNFNNDKSDEDTFGFSTGCESWEILNNTSNRVLFRTSDYSTNDWTNDFEARYPKDSFDYTNLKRMTDWVASTNTNAATNEALSSSVTYEGTVYTTDSASYRLAKFKNEFESYFEKDAMIFYYLFTETFLMVDSRAKNMFPTTYDGIHWFSLPYDMDTAIGINNEGQLVFDYSLEDIDQVNGANVYNGQDSVLWNNLKAVFSNDIKTMYATLRSGGSFSYESVNKRFSDHQAVWPEALWNEDAYEKYLEPLVADNDSSYLTMLQGNKASQRDWWLFNRFKYLDSKYETGEASSTAITLRCYQVGDITVTPYSNLYVRIKYGSYSASARCNKNESVTIHNGLDHMDDTEVYIYSADRIVAIGDLSPLDVGYADFSKALKLTMLKLGDADSNFQNNHLRELYVGNNDQLIKIDVRNCVNLGSADQKTIDLSGCDAIEEVYATGTSITGVNLPIGGKLRTLALPSSITNLTIRNQLEFTTLNIESVSNISTFQIENTPNIDIEYIVANATTLDRVRLVNVEWTATDETHLLATINTLKNAGGLDAYGRNVEKAVVVGTVNVDSITTEGLLAVVSEFNELQVRVNGTYIYAIRHLNADGTQLYAQSVLYGQDAVDPLAAELIETPTRQGSDDTRYRYSHWSDTVTNITSNKRIYAQYITTYAVNFYAVDTVYYTEWIDEHENAYDPVAAGDVAAPSHPNTADARYTYRSVGTIPTNITQPTAVYADFVIQWAVRFYNDETLADLLYTTWVYNGMGSINPINTGAISTPTKQEDAQYTYEFLRWDKAFNNITEPTNVWAVYTTTLRTYTIYWRNSDNSSLGTSTIGYGSIPEYPEGTPVHPEDEDNYDFMGWNPEIVPVVGTATYTAVYTYVGSLTGAYLAGSLEEYTSAQIEDMRQYAFYNRAAIKKITIPATTIGTYAISNNSILNAIDLTSENQISFAANSIIGNSQLQHIILRSSEPFPVNSPSAIVSNTKLNESNGGLYVKDELVSSFKNTAPYHLIKNNIYPISDYPKESFDTITDTWEEILEAEENGTYLQKYHIGDSKFVQFKTSPTSSNFVNSNYLAQIIAFDADPLANETGYAHITWTLRRPRAQYFPLTTSSDAAYSGYRLIYDIPIDGDYLNNVINIMPGWKDWYCRKRFNEYDLLLFPDVLRDGIKEVNKSFYNPLTSQTEWCADKLWSISLRELNINMAESQDPFWNIESEGPIYSDYFSNAWTLAHTQVQERQNDASFSGVWWSSFSFTSYNSCFTRSVSNYLERPTMVSGNQSTTAYLQGGVVEISSESNKRSLVIGNVSLRAGRNFSYCFCT